MNPPPKPGKAPATWSLVIRDMRQRDRTGAKKYGVRHQHDNGRNHLQDAYEEALDLAVYLRAEIEKQRRLMRQVVAHRRRLKRGAA